jgi:5-methylcytosine-specific restriction endonuclease McrA
MEQVAVLDDRALVLNRRWVPIRTATVREAVCLMVKGAAKAVMPQTYETYDFPSWIMLQTERGKPHIRTVSLTIRVPEVIQLLVYDGLPVQEIVFSRRNVFKRDRNMCQYCGGRPGTEELTIDHIQPRSQGGRSTWENCVLACVECNKRKANRLLDQAGMRLLRPPIKPRWSPRITIALGTRKESWNAFVTRAYWNVPLEP